MNHETETYEQSRKRYADMVANNGEPAKEITEERFWYLLEVLPPAKWTRLPSSESFMVIECQTGNLYTWCARVRDAYYEMIAPYNSTHEDILGRIVLSIVGSEETQH